MPAPGRPGGRFSLPYEVLAGVEPCGQGWLVALGYLQGTNVAPQPPLVLPELRQVVDYRPSFAVIAIHAPVGLPETPGQSRRCDEEARRLLGPTRALAVIPAPSRALLGARDFDDGQAIDPALDAIRWRTLSKAAEAAREIASWQRSVWEVHPELAFLRMNEGEPLRYHRRSLHGRAERADLLRARLPGVERILENRPAKVRESKLIDAAANLWTARRIVARAITRLSDPPAWDGEGVRMDIVY
jgi:predicted RNase H-like nuclease